MCDFYAIYRDVNEVLMEIIANSWEIEIFMMILFKVNKQNLLNEIKCFCLVV